MDALKGQRAWPDKTAVDCVTGQHTTIMPTTDNSREDRIIMEIVVDAYDEHERALAWYNYLEDKLAFPFRAKCLAKREISPLKGGEEVEVIGMPSEHECEREILVSVQWEKRIVAVRLCQLKGVGLDVETRQAVEDWHYWVGQGYEY